MTKLTTSLICFLAISVQAQNLVTGSDFENGMGSWYPWFVDENADWAEPPTADVEISVVSPGLGGSDHALFADIAEPGKADWYILVSKEVALAHGSAYAFSIRAKSEWERSISVGFFTNVSEGSPSFTIILELTDQDSLYGPFPFLYEVEPVQPGIKIQFGGMEGNVWIDDVSIVRTDQDTSGESGAVNSLEDIIGDVTLPHEGLPHGVPSSYDWSQAPRRGAQRPPEGWTAAIAWGQLYEWAEGNPATNTRVQIRDMEMFYLSKSDGQWHQLQKTRLVDGAAYVEDFQGDVSRPADKRMEADGSLSVTAGDGYNFHFWPSSGRIEFPADDVEGCFITVQCRLILDDPQGVDDRDEARYLMSVGGDWWESLNAVWDNWTTNADMGIGRFRFITSEWQGYNMISVPVDQFRDNPPPFAGSTGIRDSRTLSVKEFRLEQNFPNPFNPITGIHYSLKKSGVIELNVFDLLGRKVANLYNGHQTPGHHMARFDGTGLPSGVYLTKLQAGSDVLVSKMMLSK